MPSQSLLVWIVVGFLAGGLGGIVFGGWVRNFIAGMLGALVAGWAVSTLNVQLPITDFWWRHVIVAAVGAVIVIFAARTLA